MQVELIMNLKVEDLRKEKLEVSARHMGSHPSDTPQTTFDGRSDAGAAGHGSLIIQSMQDAIEAMDMSRK
jgi:hypothetical protein